MSQPLSQSKRHTELTLETAIVEVLTSKSGYNEVSPDAFHRQWALMPKSVISFLKQTQPEAWKKAETHYKEKTETEVINRLRKELEQNGCLHVLRKGIKGVSIQFSMAYFKPETSFNPTLQAQYDGNLLEVARQVKYSDKNENALDLVLFLNGIPVATAELKNAFTGQTTENAKRQYKFDRDPSEPIFRFKERALVHFVVDTDQVFLTTKLSGSSTRYLPFNKGNNMGAGNPVNPTGYKTSYLWEYIWSKDSWLDIIGKYLHIQVDEDEVKGKKIRKETMIFPRYHQIDVVRSLSKNVRANGSGQNYLVQHSAGSGKSNSIAWLAYRLSNLHNDEDEKIFTTVIVVTDRRVLDSQLQNTIYEFDHVHGVVKKIDKNSAQLAESLQQGKNIIITTLQKFPMIVELAGKLPNRNYAVIVDEAHSSQSGEASRKLKLVLSNTTLEKAAEEEADTTEEENYEDELRKTIEAHGKKENLSFFAFTATPKAKTLAVFGTPDHTGQPAPFHLYSMKQAIEEGFILDVLKNYTTYKTYFKLNKQLEDDPNVPKKRATIAVARFMSLHPHNLAQKTEVIIEHFRTNVKHKIGGKAKAMIVTGSRLHAVRYKEEIDRYIKEKGYTNLKTLVAFSGTVNADGIEYTEAGINGFSESSLPEKFKTDEYCVLVVAEKYQTGFDQPLLHTMYVDKKLSGVKAVQTLSRLNRTCPGKEDTFVLDFANEGEDIQAAFQPYYQTTRLDEVPELHHIYDLKTELEKARVIWMNEVEALVSVFYNPYFTAKDQGKMNAFIDPAVERYKALPKVSPVEGAKEPNQDDFKRALQSYIRFYGFITQITALGDLELEKWYTYSRLLIKKLPSTDETERFKLKGDEVALEYYRLQKTSEQSISLASDDGTMEGSYAAGMGKEPDEKAQLSEIIKTVNTRFGTEFTDADKLFIDQVIEDCLQDTELASQARSNTLENFSYGYNDKALNIWIDRMGQNEEFFRQVMDNQKFGQLVNDYIMKQVYQRFRGSI
jgi:type I restriction enzyme R subunit